MKRGVYFIGLLISMLLILVLAVPALAQGEFTMEIKPLSPDPAPLNVKSKGVLPIAILGSASGNVTQIIPATAELEIDASPGVLVAPIRSSIEDVNGDGYLDLCLKYKTEKVVSFFDLSDKTLYPDGSIVQLKINADLSGGGTVPLADTIRILNKGKK